MKKIQAVKHGQHIPDILQAIGQVHSVIDGHGLDRTLYHLVLLRASQINQCDYCIEMHTHEAKEDGESVERLNCVKDWYKYDIFSSQEKAAFSWTETLTNLDELSRLGELRAELRQHFTDKEISLLTVNIAMINLWNRIRISEH
ncbi:carboxymuconolactone decarboxylase family protein [Paraglaciecola sp.]|uniref:carboxymuconolactone decarboxylase family protein n=1 Tax=Paraglaciecola sp. TaxID=1920173 RepID=UPI0030F3ECC0